MSLIKQIRTVVMMNILSLPRRGWMAMATLVAVSIVVAVLLAFLAMVNGFHSTVANSGSDALGIALRAGSQAELNSGLGGDQVKLLSESPGIKRDENGPIKSAELYVVVDGIKKSTDSKANLSLRGIELAGTKLRPNFRLTKGQMFEPGKNEVIVGESVARDFVGLDLGGQIKLGMATWTVVGIFSVEGSVYESEIWTDVRTVQTQFNRGNSYQTVRFALETPGDVSAIEAYVEANPQLNLDIWTEQQYFSEQSAEIFNLVNYVAWPLAIIMALGALSGALNTMYTAVAQRTQEIATLRAIGFGGSSAFFGTLVESVVLSFLGGLLGVLIAYVGFNGMTGATLGGNFTQVVFTFQMNGAAFVQGILLALTIGLIGGLFPAFRAARVPVLKAFSLEN